MKLFVGLDVSSEKLDVCFLSDDDQLTILQEDSLGNDIEGANQIKQKSWLFKSLFVFSNCDWHGVHLHVQLSPATFLTKIENYNVSIPLLQLKILFESNNSVEYLMKIKPIKTMRCESLTFKNPTVYYLSN